jgi:hypothetical protein
VSYSLKSIGGTRGEVLPSTWEHKGFRNTFCKIVLVLLS